MKEADKRQQLINTAFMLFYRLGIHAVGINQILQESGIAKKTLYHYFPSKEALISAVVAYREQTFMQWLEAHLSVKTARPAKLIEAFFDALDEWVQGRAIPLNEFHGCFFINTCAEFSDPQHTLHQQCAAHKDTVIKLLQNRLLSAGLSSQQAGSLARTLGLLKEGVIVQAHVQGNKDSASQAKAIAQLILNNI